MRQQAPEPGRVAETGDGGRWRGVREGRNKETGSDCEAGWAELEQ